MSYSQAEQRVQNDYISALQTGNVTPASSIILSLNSVILVSWLMVCNSVSELTFQRSRLPVFFCIASISIWNLLFARSVGVVGSIGVGLSSVLCTTITVNFVLLHDPRSFRRLSLEQSIRKRETEVNGLEVQPKFVWEPMPNLIWLKIFWVLDLVTGFRGIHWSWNSSPSPNEVSLGITSRRTRYRVFRFIIDYVSIDFVKCLMIADPFFINYPTRDAPPHILPYINSTLGLYTYRTLLATAGIFLAIDLIFAFAILLQVDILGPKVLGPNASPIMFPPLWGSPHAILRKGLRGFWGETWHQIFRKHFVSIGDAVADFLLGDGNLEAAGKLNKHDELHRDFRPAGARVAIRDLTIFSLSGILHAAASYTLLGQIRPWSSFSFFVLQPFGIVIQTTFSHHLVKQCPPRFKHRWESLLCQSSNLFFTVVWLWTCSGLLLNDWASGGVWLFEPIPVSLIRGLGLSKQDKKLWCW